MSPAQVRSAIEKYTLWLADYAPKRADSAAKVGPDGLDLGHIRWMLEEMAVSDMARQKEAKANRWLGFIQGVLWAAGFASIDALKDDNR